VRLALIAIVTPIALAWRYGRDAGDEGRSLAHRWSEDGPASLGNAIAGAASRHPADPYFYMVEGVRQFNRRENPGRFLIEALRLGPGRAATHYWLARLFLASDNRGQAWPEYREALRRWPPMLQPVLHDMLHADAPVEEILQVIVDEKQLDDAGQTLLANGRESDALVVDDLLIERFPPALNARSRRIQREVRKDDVDGARRLARDLIALAPGSAVGFDALASLVSDPHLAELILETGLRTAPDDLVLLRSIARRKGARLGVAAIAPELEKLRRLASEHQGNLCDVTAILAYIAVDQNHGADALGYFEQAAAESDNGIRYLDEAARLAERNGQRSLAARLWRKIADVSGDAGANTHARDLEESIEKGAREQELGVPGSPP
jgi:tetratricopeptide (TPR) repeat protein